jgi:hypothetical protein
MCNFTYSPVALKKRFTWFTGRNEGGVCSSGSSFLLLTGIRKDDGPHSIITMAGSGPGPGPGPGPERSSQQDVAEACRERESLGCSLICVMFLSCATVTTQRT